MLTSMQAKTRLAIRLWWLLCVWVGCYIPVLWRRRWKWWRLWWGWRRLWPQCPTSTVGWWSKHPPNLHTNSSPPLSLQKQASHNVMNRSEFEMYIIENMKNAWANILHKICWTRCFVKSGLSYFWKNELNHCTIMIDCFVAVLACSCFDGEFSGGGGHFKVGAGCTECISDCVPVLVGTGERIRSHQRRPISWNEKGRE